MPFEPSEELVSKSPFVSGRFEWDTEYPQATQIPQGRWLMTECKLLKIIGHDGSDHHIKKPVPLNAVGLT